MPNTTSPHSATNNEPRRVATRMMVLLAVAAILLSCQLPRLKSPFGASASTATALPATATAATGAGAIGCALPGATVEVDDVALMVNAVVRPANATVGMSDPRNPAPAAGNVYVLVQLSATCRKESSASCQIEPGRFALQGPSGPPREPHAGVLSAPALLTITQFLGSSTIYRSVVFEAPGDEIGHVLLYENSASGAAACLNLPSWTTEVVVEYVPTPTPAPSPSPRPTNTPTPPGSPLATPTLAAVTATPTPTVLLPAAGNSGSWYPLVLGSLVLLGWLAWRALRRHR